MTNAMAAGVNMVYVLLEPDVRMAFWCGLVVGAAGVFVLTYCVRRVWTWLRSRAARRSCGAESFWSC